MVLISKGRAVCGNSARTDLCGGGVRSNPHPYHDSLVLDMAISYLAYEYVTTVDCKVRSG